MKNTIYTNKQNFKNIINKIKHDWLNNLHILADFDNTMTKAFVDWERTPSLLAVLRNYPEILWKNFAIEDSKLFEKYHPIEINPNINIEEKNKQMVNWWVWSFNLLIKSWLTIDKLRKVSDLWNIKLRKWIKEFLYFLNKKNIPLIIISANWLWIESMRYFLEKNELLFDNIDIISNDFNWDKNWKAISYKEPIIHSFNKWETILENFSKIYKKVENRKNVILLWDSLWDHHMIDGFDYDNLLKIWFLNLKEKELLESYKQRYDLILTSDNEWEILNNLFK